MLRTTFDNRRTLAIQRMKDRLEHEAFPRAQMALLVGLTGGFGLLASYTLLKLGVDSMAVRYPLALVCAYVFFLFLIWLWLRTRAEDYLDALEFADLIPRTGKPEGIADFRSEGASGTFDASAGAAHDANAPPLGSAGEVVGSAAEADEWAIPVVAVVLAIGIAVASFYVVYIAPVLFAEVLVDGALSCALFRHLRGQEPRHWLSSTFRRTAVPFAATAVFLVAVGAAMAAYAPGAKSIGQVMKHAGAQRAAR